MNEEKDALHEDVEVSVPDFQDPGLITSNSPAYFDRRSYLASPDQIEGHWRAVRKVGNETEVPWQEMRIRKTHS